MTQQPTSVPFFGTAPDEYDRRYFDNLARAFAQFVVRERNPGQGRNTTIVLTNLQDNDTGLEPGTMFQRNGVLYVSQLNVAQINGSSATAVSGNVTVSIA
jgi:hypothetical protein